jgi:DNA-binding transcriptional MerR regulator
MQIFTAEQLTTQLQQEGYHIEVRTVKYYAQIGVLSERPRVNGRRVFTEQHLEELRAILTIKKTGKNLSEIKSLISNQPRSALKKISRHSYLSAEYLLEHETVNVHPHVTVTFHKNINPQWKEDILKYISNRTKEDKT